MKTSHIYPNPKERPGQPFFISYWMGNVTDPLKSLCREPRFRHSATDEDSVPCDECSAIARSRLKVYLVRKPA